MAAKRKKAKKSRKPAKRKGAKKTAKRKVAKKRKAAPRRKPSARRKKLAKALAPSMERMKSSASEMGHASIDAGRLLFDEAKETTKDAGEKVKDMTTDWINRVT
jgi:hypothetical protein